MDLSVFAPENYQWQLSLIALVASLAIPALATYLLVLIPTFKRTQELNHAAAADRVKRSFYMPIQKRSMFWGLTTQLAIFALIIPFVVTTEPQPWWNILLDVFVILMFYDFFYYLTHRFLFHDGGFGPGPLMWVHSVHHQQKNPCRKDSSYLHPIETCMGLALYGGSIGFLGWAMGDFHLITIIVTWIAFSEINLHNHDLMEGGDRFPFKYLKYMSFMHHVHHARFTAGNFATISLFYDWLFGTYDVGHGWQKKKQDATEVAAK
jgi:sterol desaturase/sphingolipid hydroxylase (fatty acid hydroxylase superfamily)